MSKINLSIIIPVLDESNNIEKLTYRIIKYLKKYNYEIIFVDDNSKDNSKVILEKLKNKYNFFNPIFRKKNRDLTQSCFDGIKKSKFEFILIMDGDLQHDPKYIPKMADLMKNNNDIVIGARPLVKGPNAGLSETRRLVSKILIYLFSIFRINTSDPMSGFFLFKKKLFKKNQKNLFGKGFKILADLLINSEKKLKTVDYFITFKRRYSDKSKMGLKILLILVQFYFFSLLKKIKIVN